MTKAYDPFDPNNPFAAFPTRSIDLATSLAAQFDRGAFLLEESDAHLSAALGCKIASLYPEDMGVNNDIESKKAFLRGFIARNLPRANLDHDDECYDVLAHADSAQIIQLFNGTRLVGALILKPSKLISSDQTFANASGISVALIKSQLSKIERDFLDCQHEVGHALSTRAGQFQGDDFLDKHINEMLSDLTSILSYYKRQPELGERSRISMAVINERALAGFLAQPPQYWLAPVLAEATSDPNFGPFRQLETNIDPYHQTWASYSELRTRTAAHMMGLNSLRSLDSTTLQKTLKLWDYSQFDDNPPPEQAMIDAIRSIESWGSEEFNAYRFNGSLIEALSAVANDHPLGEFTQKCAVQILRAAQIITPTLAIALPSYSHEGKMSFAPSAP